MANEQKTSPKKEFAHLYVPYICKTCGKEMMLANKSNHNRTKKHKIKTFHYLLENEGKLDMQILIDLK